MLDVKRAALLANYARFRLHRKFYGARAIPEQAQKSWVIAPPETVSMRPAVALPGEFERVRIFERWTTEEIEWRRVFGGESERSAVVAHEVRDAILYKGSIFASGAERRIRPMEVPPPSGDFTVESIEEGALATSFLGLMYFGHWLRDDGLLSIMAKDYGTPFAVTPQPWSHIDDYVNLLDLPWRPVETAICKKLVIFDDEDFTRHKAMRLERLRSRMQKKLGPPKNRGQRVFIKRGVADNSGRTFSNEAEIADRLVQEEGFIVLDPSRMAVPDFTDALHGAALLVSAEGSQLVHGLYTLPLSAGLLSITSPYRFCTPNKRWTDLLGMDYGFVVGDAVEEGFVADYDRLRRTIDLFAG